MTYRKKLIEVALPLEAINVASAREKSIRHGHPSTLHLWWARRPLAACRAVIFTSLVDDPDDPEAPPEFVAACRALPKGKNATGVDQQGNSADTPRQRLFDFIERLVTWEATTDEKILNTARELIRLATDGNPPPLLDPFAGGGSIPLEAQRLGLEAHASDLNPVAVMINKALIEIPPKFAGCPPVNPRDRQKVGGTGNWKGAAGLAADVRYYGEWMRERAWERIGHLYPKHNGETVIAWLWARTVKCPNPACGAQMPLITTFELSKKKSRRAWLEPQVDRQSRVTFIVKQGKGKISDPPKVGRGASFRCIVCAEIAPEQHIKIESTQKRMESQLIAIVTEGTNGRNYHAPDRYQAEISKSAKPKWRPTQEMNRDTRDLVSGRGYGFFIWADLFTPRQLAALATFNDLVAEAREQILADAIGAGLRDSVPLRDGGTGAQAYCEAVSIYLSLGLSKLADYNSSLVLWSPSRDQAKPTFARQALAMVWDYAEVNPFAGAAGDLNTTLTGLGRIIEHNLPAHGIGLARQADATTIKNTKAICISTDPPYYDNISYADLSDFFYIWQRPLLKEVYPDLFGTLLVPKSQELVATRYRFKGDLDAATLHFETGLIQAFFQMRDIIPLHFPLTVYYAFKQEEVVADGTASTGWETMLNGLIKSGFSIAGTWPIRTERSVRTISLGTNALASSIVLVCRPRPENAPVTSRRDFVNALRHELPAALREMQSGNIAPVDLAQASIGPGMAVYSRYSKVLEPNGDRLSVRTALQLINQVLDEFLAETEGDLDPDSRFAVAWFEQYGFKSGDFGVADVLARAKNTSVDGLRSAGVLTAGAGSVRLLPWDELDPGWDPAADPRLTVWEATHHLIERLHSHGEEGAAMLLAKMPPDLAAAARQLAYRLYSICERKGWADLARDYNALVISWSSSQERAAEFKTQYQQQRLL
jgi:putative DNA methylase